MTEPVALSDLKTHLRLDQGATDEDAYLQILITAARRACEGRTKRSIVGRNAAMTLDAFPRRPFLPVEAEPHDILFIDLDGGTVSSVTSIGYTDAAGVAQTLDPATYVADLADVPARVAPVLEWPIAINRPASVQITYVISPMEPNDLAVVKQAILLLAGNWYTNREAAVVDTRGAPTELPLAVSWLLQPLFQFSTS